MKEKKCNLSTLRSLSSFISEGNITSSLTVSLKLGERNIRFIIITFGVKVENIYPNFHQSGGVFSLGFPY